MTFLLRSRWKPRSLDTITIVVSIDRSFGMIPYVPQQTLKRFVVPTEVVGTVFHIGTWRSRVAGLVSAVSDLPQCSDRYFLGYLLKQLYRYSEIIIHQITFENLRQAHSLQRLEAQAMSHPQNQAVGPTPGYVGFRQTVAEYHSSSSEAALASRG